MLVDSSCTLCCSPYPHTASNEHRATTARLQIEFRTCDIFPGQSVSHVLLVVLSDALQHSGEYTAFFLSQLVRGTHLSHNTLV